MPFSLSSKGLPSSSGDQPSRRSLAERLLVPADLLLVRMLALQVTAEKRKRAERGK